MERNMRGTSCTRSVPNCHRINDALANVRRSDSGRNASARASRVAVPRHANGTDHDPTSYCVVRRTTTSIDEPRLLRHLLLQPYGFKVPERKTHFVL